MRKKLLAVPVLAVAALSIPSVRRWLDTVMIRTIATTVRTNKRI